MLTVYCDESDDGQTHSLAGWMASPTAWHHFDRAWRAMLATIKMPDGARCRAFHSADIVSRDKIADSPFKGWAFEDERDAFKKAIAVIENRDTAAKLYPVGVSLQIPSSFHWMQRDSIWLLLFMKMFIAIGRTFPAQRSIAFMFDEKKAIESHALEIHAAAKKTLNSTYGEEYLSSIAFDDDEAVVPLQAADLLAYEWRKRISDETERPTKDVRQSYKRMRAARNEGMLWRYGRSLFDEVVAQVDPVTADQTREYIRWFMLREPTHLD